jgi:hypothetical protein
VGVSVERANGAQELTGEAAADEHIAAVTVVARAGDTAALLVTTTCGNATLASLRWTAGAWRSGQHLPLVSGMRPGRCGQTETHAEAVALSSDARDELVVTYGGQDATGDSVIGPFLSVYQLAGQGVLRPLLQGEPFGGTDDATGATRQAQYYVIADVPPPRELHVAERPGRLGPGGAPVQEIVRRRYALRGDHLVLIQRTAEPVEP